MGRKSWEDGGIWGLVRNAKLNAVFTTPNGVRSARRWSHVAVLAVVQLLQVIQQGGNGMGKRHDQYRDPRYAYVHRSLDLEGATPAEELGLEMRSRPFGLLMACDYANALNHLGSTYRIRTIEFPEGLDVYDRDKKWEVVRKVFIEADEKRKKCKKTG
tara:strand:- start:865 stop:1338 length:474 start_codon:yes stop_codon:yes gene_type:complete